MRVAARAFRKIRSVKSAIEKIDRRMKLHHYNIRNFRPHVSFEFERGKFILKTAQNGAELAACLQLRFEVFHREYMKKKRTYGVDVDRLDDICDHLVIIEKESNRVIGTYRLNSSRFTEEFYTATEFNIEELLRAPGNKLELGRACIDREFRNGTVISLLWRGIFEYARLTETQLLFGCTSIKTMEPLQIGLVTKHVRDTLPVDELRVRPVKKHKVKSLKTVLEYIEANPYEYDRESIEGMIPTLFTSYLNLGAKVCAEPAIDREFGCIDFLTVLRLDEMNPVMKGKYKV